MTTDEIRARFLKFFEARGHRIVPSDSLVPAKDPSILFTGAGMNQFKEQFLGRNVAFRRAATSQKCLRTADLENVGRTPSHHTFFEMLGNFSFGDYFKKEAILWAWEFLTKDLKLKPQDLKVSVYEDDRQAYDIWLTDIKVPSVKIMKLGDKENFWPAQAPQNGPNGPCGPCSEIYYDSGSGEPVEIWNLVFTQFNRKEGGVLEDLPAKNIDTGMGLERLASVMQGVKTNFEIDIFIPIIDAICKELAYKKGINKEKDAHINAIADHIRAITFTIADGVYPSNEERGFVVRKLVRRSLQRALQVKPGAGLFLYKIVPSVARTMKTAYPEIEKQREGISQIVKKEEERFQSIVSEVVPLMKEEFEAFKDSGRKIIPGDVIFKYSDEKGVPFDFQKEIAGELGLSLDIEEFNKFLELQKARSRKKSKISKEIFAAPAGLARKKDEEWDEASKQRIRMNHTATHLLHSALRRVLGEHARQAGSLVYPDRLRFDFTHPKKLEKDEIIKVEELVNQQISAASEVKKEIMGLEEAKSKGATALFGEKYTDEVTVRTIGDFSKELCGGDHVDNTKEIRIFKIIQEGSVGAGSRRIEAQTGDDVYEWLAGQAQKQKKRLDDELAGLETIKADRDLGDKAKKEILELTSWLEKKSRELLAYADIKEWMVFEAGLLNLIEEISDRKKKTEKELGRKKEEDVLTMAGGIIKNSRDINGVKVISAILPGKDMGLLRKMIDVIGEKAGISVILLASGYEGKANLVLAVAKDLVTKGFDARELMKPIAACVGGSGGGRPDMAQAGGKDAAKITEAVKLIYGLIEEKLR